MIRFAAINSQSPEGRKHKSALTKGKDALEAENFALYDKALRCQYEGKFNEAEKLYQDILASPLIANNDVLELQKDDLYYTLPMVTLQYLANKNFASLCETKDRKTEALQYYAKALTVDGRDVVVWYHMARLSESLGRWRLARFALEQGLKACPSHWLSVDKLAEVLFILGDYGTCMTIVDRMLEMEPGYSKAKILKAKILEENPDNKFKVEALLWEAGDAETNIDELVEKRRKRQKVADWDVPMSGTEETPREFVLKDKTWNGFADLLFDIYKEMASEKGKSNFLNDPIHITSPFQPTPSSSPLPSSSNKIDAASGFTFNPPNLSISESGTAPNLPNTTDLTSSSGSVATPNVESNSKIVIDSNSNSSDSSEANLNSSSSSVNSIQSEATSKLSTSTNGTNKSGEGETTPSASATSTAASAASAASAAAAAAAEGTRRQSTRKKADTVPLSTSTRQSQRVKEIKHDKISSDLDEFLTRLISVHEDGSNTSAPTNSEMKDKEEIVDESSNSATPSLPPTPSKEDEKKEVEKALLSFQNRTPALRGIVDWIIAFLGEICQFTTYYWGPAVASKVMGLQALCNKHCPWYKKYYLTIAELHFDAHMNGVTSIGHQPAPTFTPTLHLAECHYYSSQVFVNSSTEDAEFQIRLLWLKANSCIQAEEISLIYIIPMAMECLEGCKQLMEKHDIPVIWVAHCTQNRYVTAALLAGRQQGLAGQNTLATALDSLARGNFSQVIESLSPVARSYPELPLTEPDGRSKEINGSKRNSLKIFDLLYQSYMKLNDIKNAFWCCGRMLEELLPHYNQPEIQGHIQSLLDNILLTEKHAQDHNISLSTINLLRLKRAMRILVKKSTVPAVLTQGMLVVHALHENELSPAQRVVLFHLTHSELGRRKSCYLQEGKFLRQYISALIPFVFQEEPLSTEEWNALAEYRITPSFELAQCFGCLYGIKLLPYLEDHPHKTTQTLKSSKDIMLLYMLLRFIYQENKLKPQKETRDALAKLYSSFKEPPERVTPLKQDIEKYLLDLDVTLPQQKIKEIKEDYDSKSNVVTHPILKNWKTNINPAGDDMDTDYSSNSDFDFVYNDLYFLMANSSETDALYELLKKDMYCNPWRENAWIELGKLYYDQLVVLTEEKVLFFPSNPSLLAEVENLNRLSDRHLTQALKLEQNPAVEEILLRRLGLLLYQQHKWITLPSYPLSPSPSPSLSLSLSPPPSTTSDESAAPEAVPETNEAKQKKKEKLENAYSRAYEYFSRARDLNSKEWMYPSMLGKIARKCGKPLEESLKLFKIGSDMKKEPEPLYRLHNARLKLVLNNPDLSSNELDILESFFFAAPSETDLNETPVELSKEERYKNLINDCYAGMKECVNEFKWFHKAIYKLAYLQMFGPNPDIKTAHKTVSTLYKPTTSKFWYIWDKDNKRPPGKLELKKVKYLRLYIQILEANNDKAGLKNCLDKVKNMAITPVLAENGVMDELFSALCKAQANVIQQLGETLKNAANEAPLLSPSLSPSPLPSPALPTTEDPATSSSSSISTPSSIITHDSTPVPSTTSSSSSSSSTPISASSSSSSNQLESLEGILAMAWDTHSEAASKSKPIIDAARNVFEQAFRLYVTYNPETTIDESTDIIQQAIQLCDKKHLKNKRKLGEPRQRRKKVDQEKGKIENTTESQPPEDETTNNNNNNNNNNNDNTTTTTTTSTTTPSTTNE